MSSVPPHDEAFETARQMTADGAAQPASNQEPVLLESDVPLSQSLIWRL